MNQLVYCATWFVFGGCCGGLAASVQYRRWSESLIWVVGIAVSVFAIGALP